MNSVLIIDGDEESRTVLREYLKKEGYKVYYSDRAKPGMEKAREKVPDLIVCELVFQDMEEFQLIKEIRSDMSLKHIPLVVLSHRKEDMDKVLALELGADDYIVKPAGLRETAAKIKVQFRYTRKRLEDTESERKKTIKVGDIVINPIELEIVVGGEKLVFSSKEFKILAALLENRRKTVKREYIISRAWGDGLKIPPSLLGGYINNIKRKICRYSRYNFIIRMDGKTGYKVEISEKVQEPGLYRKPSD